jgi:hypothetical protein
MASLLVFALVAPCYYLDANILGYDRGGGGTTGFGDWEKTGLMSG